MLETAAAAETRPHLLGWAVPFLLELALRPGHRPTRHRGPLAPAGLQAELALDITVNEIGRPKIDVEIRGLIRRMLLENPLWGTPRIQSELRHVGCEATKATVDECKVRHHKPRSPTWQTFLDNHVRDIVAVDFFTVPTVAFRILFCFIVLRHGRREVLHFNITANPTASWTAQQVVEAFPEETAPRFLIRDRDSIYGEFFRQRIKDMGSEEVVTAYRSPGQNPYVECLIGSIRHVDFISC